MIGSNLASTSRHWDIFLSCFRPARALWLMALVNLAASAVGIAPALSSVARALAACAADPGLISSTNASTKRTVHSSSTASFPQYGERFILNL